MRTTLLITTTALLSLPLSTLADPVDPDDITTFQAGQPACAADVNETIQALITAVNDNAARVAELEAALRNAHRPLQDLVSGSTYNIYSQAVGNGLDEQYSPGAIPNTTIVGVTHGALAMWSYYEVGELVLNDDGTVSLTTENHERELYLSTYSTHDVDSQSVPEVARVDLTSGLEDVQSGTLSGTWVLSGQELTLTFGTGEDQDQSVFTVSPDGENLMLGGKETENLSYGSNTIPLLEGNFAMGVRINPPDIFVETFDGAPYPNNGPTIEFAAQPGESVFRSVRIVNLGDSDLTNMSVDITPFEGPGQIYEIVKGLDGPTLGPGEQVLITMRFTNTSPGNAFATLEIDSDDPDTSTFDVNLRGF